jgi:hypothetical protein
VADEADGAGQVPRLAGDEIVLTQGEQSQQAVDAIEASRLDVLLRVPANRLTALAPHYTTDGRAADRRNGELSRHLPRSDQAAAPARSSSAAKAPLSFGDEQLCWRKQSPPLRG